jgi:hypothetical protein
METVTLMQTKKITKPMPIVLYGTDYWDEVLNIEPMVRHGTVGLDDLSLFHRSNSVDDAFEHLTGELTRRVLQTPEGEEG